MENLKTCINGHNYDGSKYASCPFCPGSIASNDYDKTMKDFKKTVIMEELGNNQFEKTMSNDDSKLKTTSPGHPFSRTSIVVKDGENKESSLDQTNKRKLVGWLVTFTTDEFGQDYKLYVGKNKIGSGVNNDIIVNDSSVSSEHAVLLFRENEFIIKDSFSTNGTKVNGALIDEDKLKDGDELKLGNTVFKLKTVF